MIVAFTSQGPWLSDVMAIGCMGLEVASVAIKRAISKYSILVNAVVLNKLDW